MGGSGRGKGMAVSLQEEFSYDLSEFISALPFIAFRSELLSITLAKAGFVCLS